MYLIAAVSDPSWLGWGFNVLKVIIGLGMVIFVHELGHFLVAKLCGVKCEKFYLGFDFFGLKLWKFRRGETEYGIGVFPLGGYVKMLGQEDNPARLREELERAKARQAAIEAGEESLVTEGSEGQPTADGAGSSEETLDVAAAEQALFDPRSYLAKSVPKRMAIISAGVIMNVIFAFFMAVAALGLGVQDVRCGIGEVVPGKAAWQVHLMPGDQIIELAGRPVDRWQELRTGISLGDVADGVTMVVKRPGQEKPISVTVMPDRTGRYPTIGVGVPMTNTLGETLPVWPGTASASAGPEKFQPGDTVVGIDDAPVASYAEVRRQLALHPDGKIRVTVARSATPAEAGNPEGAGDEPADSKAAKPANRQLATIEVGPQPMRRLGLIMEMGPIVAVQDNSPALKAGIQPGDVVESVDGRPAGDPLTLSDRLGRRAGQKVALTVVRHGEKITLKDVELARANWFAQPFAPKSPVSVASLGIAYRVLNKVAGVVEGSPAAQAKIIPGSVVVEASILPPDAETIESEGLQEVVKVLPPDSSKVEFDEEQSNWPYLINRLQGCLPGTQVKVMLKDEQGQERSVTLAPAAAADWFDPLRGLVFESDTFIRQAHSLSEAISMGYRETIDSLLLIYRTLEKLSSGQVSAKELIGPLGIIQVASRSASAGTGELLLFLTILSANLAVLNFLPIPVLDGGHMVFLAYEGIRGKPPSERVFLGLSYLGLFLLLALMIYVTGLDVHRWIGR
jgi:regulator of sigma E protease